jgi:acyl-coenzyme A synthetase/AMP-(fatty) acid ligase
MAAVTTLSFDMSVTELFLPMMVGASVVMVSREDVREGRRLARRLADSGATAMQAAPSIWRLWLQGLSAMPDAAVPLRAWCGGEPVTAALATELLRRCPEVWNFYGPTETAVFSVIGRVSAEALSPVKVGRPIANTQVQVLDERLRPLPLGAVGEIGIAGAGVAIGYWGRDELTAQRFVADPLRPGQRLYRTGDLGRWHADGTLECLGRLDHQVKLRGHRIELGEIEGALGACGVLESAVSVVAPAGQEPALVAHVVLPPQPGTGDAERLRALREQLRLRLPDVMLPTHWVALPQLPLLPNGKVNRQALPAPARSERLEPDAAPLTERQQAVAAIWRQHLGLGAGAPLRAQDNFFDLGGHSLLAAQVSADMEAALGWRVGVPRLVMESLGQLAQGGAPIEPPAAARAGALAGWMRRWGARR